MADSDDSDPVEAGVELLASIEAPELSVKEAMDRIELITTEPQLQREILEVAAARGAIERDGTTVAPERGRYLRFGSDVIQREGEFDCRRCGATLQTGYFLDLESGELGPFGSSCIRKVTGRD